MSIRLIDPTVPSAMNAHATAPRLGDLEGLRIGLLGNGKVNADVLLEQTAQLFAERHGCRVLELEEKGHAGKPCPPDLLKSIADESDFLLTAAGD